MVSKAAVEESDKEGCNSGGEEIIELPVTFIFEMQSSHV